MNEKTGEPLAVVTHQFEVSFHIADARMEHRIPSLHDHPGKQLNLGRTRVPQQPEADPDRWTADRVNQVTTRVRA
jgi:hypothetical protein